MPAPFWLLASHPHTSLTLSLYLLTFSADYFNKIKSVSLRPHHFGSLLPSLTMSHPHTSLIFQCTYFMSGLLSASFWPMIYLFFFTVYVPHPICALLKLWTLLANVSSSYLQPYLQLASGSLVFKANLSPDSWALTPTRRPTVHFFRVQGPTVRDPICLKPEKSAANKTSVVSV